MKKSLGLTTLGVPLGQLFKWLIRDDFSQPLAAGSVHATAAYPGPGTRTVVDIGADALSLAGGQAVFANPNATAGDPGIWYDAVTRANGRVFVASIQDVDDVVQIGWDANQAGAMSSDLITFAASNVIQGGATTAVGTWAASTEYKVALVLRAAGSYLFIKGGAFTSWTLLWQHGLTSGNVYPGISNNNSTAKANFARVPVPTWLPGLIAYDTFTRSNGALGTSEATGPESQGVVGRTWSFSSGIWTVATNKAIATPGLGSSLWDADASTFEGVSTYAWAAYGANTIANVSNELEITYVDHNGGAYNYFRNVSDLSSDLTVGKWYRIDCGAYVTATDSAGLIVGNAVTVYGPLLTNTTKAAQVITMLCSSAAANYIGLYNISAGEQFYLDDITIKQLTTADLFASVTDSTTSDVVVRALVTIPVMGSHAGICLNLDSVASPANFIIAVHDGFSCSLMKCVAGTYTTVITAAAAYAAGAEIMVVKSGTSYALYWNGAKVGSTGTVSDAGIISNTKHGLFSTYADNSLDGFAVWPRGTLAEHNGLNRYV